MSVFGALKPAERALAQSVYAGSLPYDRIVLTTLNLGGAVTLMLDEVGMVPVYTINWLAGYETTQSPVDQSAAFIHELVHVWQGHNGLVPGSYMLESALAQGYHGVRDWIRSGRWRG